MNVSALQLRDMAFADGVQQAMARHGLGRQVLVLELTESTLLADSDAAQRAMAALHVAGVQLAVDDFGTGYSSLSAPEAAAARPLEDRPQLRARPAGREADDRALVQAMFGMAQALGIAVVAEGVETAAQRDWLAERGGHLQQGWLYSRAVPAADFEALLDAQPASV